MSKRDWTKPLLPAHSVDAERKEDGRVSRLRLSPVMVVKAESRLAGLRPHGSLSHEFEATVPSQLFAVFNLGCGDETTTGDGIKGWLGYLRPPRIFNRGGGCRVQGT